MGGGTSGTHSGLRATINAWLEDISFRTGMIAGAVVLLVIAAAGVAGAVLSHGGQAVSALGSRAAATPATLAAPATGGAAQPSAAPSSAAPARSRSAASTPAPARSAASAPSTGSPSAAPATGSGPVRSAAAAAASGAGRESYGLASPAGWRHGFPAGWGGRGWVWGPYRGGPHFGGPWW